MWKLKFKIIIFLCLFIAFSCGHISSGHYVQILPGQKIKDIAKRYKVTVSEIQLANPRSSLKTLDWVFIPLKRGIAGQGSVDTQLAYSLADKSRFLWPVPSSKIVSSGFGHRWGRHHKGIDIVAKGGTHILAADSGVVIYSGNGLRGFGNMVVIKHAKNLIQSMPITEKTL